MKKIDKIWESSGRRTVYTSKFLTVYEENIKLPNGSKLDNYSLVKLPSAVTIVATDTRGNLIAQREYKHAAGKFLLVLPAGHVEDGEEAVAAAKRELEEETGYAGGQFRHITSFYEYPTKCLHTISVVRAEMVELSGKISREPTEFIEQRLIPVSEISKMVLEGAFATAGSTAAIAVCGLI